MPRKFRVDRLRIKRECQNCGNVPGGENCAECQRDPRLRDNWIPHPRLLRECHACGNVWALKEDGVEPLACPACHSRRWNRDRRQPGPKRAEGGAAESQTLPAKSG